MRIAFISTMRGNVWGGSEELWFEAAREAAGRGDEVIVSVGYWSKLAPKLDVLEALGVKVHVQESPRSLLKKSDIAGRLISKFKQIRSGTQGYTFLPVREFNPDIICVSQANTYDIPRFPHLRDFLVKQEIPYAIVCHGHEDIPLDNDEVRSLIKTHFEGAIWVGFVAHALLTSAERHLAASIKNAVVVRNPVNLADTSEVPFAEPEEVFRFACVGRLEVYQKGQDILFEALSGSIWRDRNWQLSIAGEGVHLEYLQKLAAHYGIENKVKFLGQVADLRGLWREHHLLTLPSRYEGTPLALVEAMLCGRSAVVTDVAGNTEWIEDDINGFVAEGATVQSLERTLERAWNHRAGWKQLGAAARLTALTQYVPNPGAALLDLLAERNTKN